jgi:diguanylate cyclase (GGDEF)-like protein/PAS domain S-box-containing protein
MRALHGASTGVKRALSSEQNDRLRADIRLYSDLVHHLHVGIAIWRLEDLNDPKTLHLIFANSAAEKYLTVPGEPVSGKMLAGIFPGLLDTQLPKILQEVARSGEAKELGEIRYGNEKVLDGTFSARLYPLPDRCVCLAFEDLTEQKKAARTISDQAKLLDLVTDSIFVCDMDGRITYWNQGAERMYGWAKQEVLGQSAFQALKTECSTPFEEIQKLLLRDGHWQGELSHAGKDRTRITVSSHWKLQRDETDLPIGWVQINSNVSEEKRAGEALRKTEERFHLLVDSIRDYAIFHLDPHGRVATWNLGANRIKGYSKEEIIGKHFSIFYPPEDIAAGKPEAALQIAAQEGRYEDEGWRVRKDGSRFLASVIITALRDQSGSLCGFGKVTRDVTERREAENARQETRALQQRTTEITLLSQLGTLLHACLTTEEAFKVFGQFAPRLFPNESGALYVLSPSHNVLESASSWGDFPAGEQVFPPDDCWALRSGRMHYVDEASSAVLCSHLSATPTVAHLCVPMAAQGETLGILHVHSNPMNSPGRKEAIRPLSVSDRQLATAVAEQVGLALANLKLRETLRLLSVRDPLTGLFNRRFMQESLERELRRAARSNKPLGGILLDIDHFKQFNDSYGHEAGDTVLRELGGFLHSQIRGEDIACRVGGEEFLLILPDTSLDTTLQRAEKLREESKKISIQYGGRPLATITLSMGVAAFPVHGNTCDAVLRSADEALYQAKAQGRDRVVVAKPIHEAG